MILINTIGSDLTTQKVVDWLEYFNAKFCLINENSFLELDKISRKEMIISVNKKRIEITPKTCYWYRRGTVIFNRQLIANSINLDNGKRVQDYLVKENSKLHNLINSFPFKNRIGNYINNDINKVKILNDANNMGIVIPEYMITGKKEELIKFKKQNKKIITKSISDLPMLDVEGGDYRVYTSLVDDDYIKKMPNIFFPSMFQKYIDKKFEIRVFFFDNEFHCAAIMSQQDSQTTVDFRNYNKLKPNRIESFELPKDVQRKISRLMDKNDLRLGVIDLIYSTEDEFVFLEVNPIGQFGNISQYCFANLSKLIAEKLIQNNTKN